MEVQNIKLPETIVFSVKRVIILFLFAWWGIHTAIVRPVKHEIIFKNGSIISLNLVSRDITGMINDIRKRLNITIKKFAGFEIPPWLVIFL
jgi:hypothetical protein